MNEAQGRTGKNWGRREFYKLMIAMSDVASQEKNENVVISSGQKPNAIVRRWMGERHSKLEASVNR